MCVCMCVCESVCVCVPISVCVCVCVYTIIEYTIVILFKWDNKYSIAFIVIYNIYY